jgi:hypothetical protein
MSLTDVNLFRIDGNIGFTSNLQTSALNGGPLAGTRNRTINGDMRIDQRNAGASVTPSSGSTYLLDRWYVYNSQASKFSAQQNAGSVTPPSDFANYIGITSLSAYSVLAGDEFLLTQRVEGFNTSDLAWGTANAKAVTLSFWVRSSLTGSFGGAVKNSAANRSYLFSFTVNTSGTWEYKTITIPGDASGTWLTTNGIGISLGISLGTGSTYLGAAGSWSGSNFDAPTGSVNLVATSGATFYITGVQLEPGTTATPFERRSFGQELALCQRYYQVFGDLNLTISGRSTNAATTVMPIVFRTTMRTAPTVAGTLTVGSGLSFSSTIDTMRVIGTADGNGTFVVSNSTASAEL